MPCARKNFGIILCFSGDWLITESDGCSAYFHLFSFGFWSKTPPLEDSQPQNNTLKFESNVILPSQFIQFKQAFASPPLVPSNTFWQIHFKKYILRNIFLQTQIHNSYNSSMTRGFCQPFTGAVQSESRDLQTCFNPFHPMLLTGVLNNKMKYISNYCIYKSCLVNSKFIQSRSSTLLNPGLPAPSAHSSTIAWTPRASSAESAVRQCAHFC